MMRRNLVSEADSSKPFSFIDIKEMITFILVS